MNNNLALFLTHNIFLTNEQIDKFFQDEKISVVGVSVPVWVNAKTSETTEPAMEIFCEYKISIGEENDVFFRRKGYEISLINKPEKNPKPIDFESLSKMSSQERFEFEKKRDKILLKQNADMSLNNLLRVGYFRIEIKKINQILNKIKDCDVDIQHVVQIKTNEKLLKTLVM